MFKQLQSFLASLTQEQMDNLNAFVARKGLNQGDEDAEAIWLRECQERLAQATEDAAQVQVDQLSEKIRAAVKADPAKLAEIATAIDAAVKADGAGDVIAEPSAPLNP